MIPCEVAAKILDKLANKQGTIKSLIMKEKHADKKYLHALICQTLKYQHVLNEIIEKSKISVVEKLPHSLLMVLIHDLLFGKGIRNASKYKAVVQRHKTRLNAELVRIKIKKKCKNNEDLIPDAIRNAVEIPRYVRINTLKTTQQEAIRYFNQQGYNFGDSESCFIDEHVPNLIALPSNTDLHNDKFLTQGKIVLQDKASCLPAFVLNPPKNSVIIDGCAAPGNKTSHLSAIMQNTGKIYAFDKDEKRLNTLKRLTSKVGCTNIVPIHCSFLDTDPSHYSDVEYILLDPSCSGSGIVKRLDYLTDDMAEESEIVEKERISSLAEFQIQCILHAFEFKNVRRVVYSTCSTNDEENECVVEAVLKSKLDFRLVENVLPNWDCRGHEIMEGGTLI